MKIIKAETKKPTHTQILLAAIEHLQAMYLRNPDRCLSLMINRNYSLLIEQNASHPDRNNWLNQKMIWQRSYQQNQTKNPVDLMLFDSLALI
jgi:hypothetical protein